MSEFAMSNAKKPGLPSFNLIAVLFKVFFTVLSHPLYFSYFIFFSPYLLKLFSFLSPLFVTTTLLVLAFLGTVSPSLLQDRADSLEKPRPNDQDFPHFEESEVYKIVFDVSHALLEIREDPIEVVKETCSETYEETIAEEKIEQPKAEVESLRWCLDEEKKEWENMSSKKVDAKVKPLINEESDSPQKEELFTRSGSKATVIISNKVKENSEAYFASPEWDLDDKCSVKSSSVEGSPRSNNLGSFGSMRKEKEWRRTLACKLFEERHNAADGSEGMDLLWETYETSDQSNKAHNKMTKTASKNGAKKGKKSVLDYSDDDDEEYEDETNGQLCCLQALKFSAGKVNLGMARPNLVKISKALKGIGWLHSVTRHGKKRNN